MIPIIKHLNNSIDEIILKNDYLEVHVLTLGCTITKIITKNKENKETDVVLGYDKVEDYMHYDAYLGALVGRVANRIKDGTFSLNNKTYTLPINNGPNSLHGGITGLSYRIFHYELNDNEVKFSYYSPNNDQGYPGNMHVYAKYRIENHTLKIEYSATSDEDTLINLTNHSYFNLNGYPSNIDTHYLKIAASNYQHVDENGLAINKFEEVKDTPFDYINEKQIKEEIYKENKQLEIGHGYDHPFIFNKENNQVSLFSEESGIELTVSTSYPLAQIYTANYLDGRKGKEGLPMHERSAICIETQYMPDSIHLEENSPTILKKGEVYEAYTSYTFKVR